MATPTLTIRELNRALLARQMLLEREALSHLKAIERLVGLQAQLANPPYIGLWTRLQDFQRGDLTRLMERRQVVRATLMRATLHLFTAQDYVQFRPAIQPALTRALRAFFGKRADGIDIERLVIETRTFVEEQPRTFIELRTFLSRLQPAKEPEALAYAIRTHLPLVQVPPGGTWGVAGSPTHTTAEAWLERPLSTTENLPTLILRYLAAFGPATVRDIQTWSGLSRLQEAVKALKPELRVLRDEQGNELLDVPNMPLPPADSAAPPRFLPEYDNLILSHAERGRVIADKYRSQVFLSAGRVRATFLVDGFVQGTWRIERNQGVARLIIEPFETLSDKVREGLAEEGERLLHFVEESAKEFDIHFAHQE